MRAAVIVAGGYGTRFDGRDKAVAAVGGVPMIRRVADAVASLVDDVVVNLRDDQRAAIETALEGLSVPVTYAVDPVPDRGPLAGIATGLAATDAEYALVVACDMPLVDPDFVEYLFEQAAGRDGAVPVERGDDREWVQPLQAVYRVDAALAAARESMDAGASRPLDAIADLDVHRVDVADTPGGAATLDNVNTRAQLRDVERRLAEE
ncbi:MAG: molybdenum cofactor guanylyltransferase [Halanaeroarchaeum sp.]